MKYIKRLFCRHKYCQIQLLGWKYDYDYGVDGLVRMSRKKCIKCGKTKRCKRW